MITHSGRAVGMEHPTLDFRRIALGLGSLRVLQCSAPRVLEAPAAVAACCHSRCPLLALTETHGHLAGGKEGSGVGPPGSSPSFPQPRSGSVSSGGSFVLRFLLQEAACAPPRLPEPHNYQVLLRVT